jgi:hypothetical protein
MCPNKKQNFMAALDSWTDEMVIRPLFAASEDFDDEDTYDRDKTVEIAKRYIQEKVPELQNRLPLRSGLGQAGDEPSGRTGGMS